MKHIQIFIALAAITVLSCKTQTDPESEIFNLKDCGGSSRNQEAEAMITRASDYCLNQSKNTDSLRTVLRLLKTEETKPGKNALLQSYWMGFCQMHIAICQMSMKQDAQADSSIQTALDLLTSLKKKNSEVYALLALLQGMSINYKSAMTLTVAAEKCKLYSEKSIKLNPNNLRGYLALAIFDFYTPEIYQGGRIAEKNLIKALELNERIDNRLPCLPGWGKDLTYRYLVRFYLKNKKKELALRYLKEAMEHYPADLSFQNLQQEIK